jgi:hypothetical protein
MRMLRTQVGVIAVVGAVLAACAPTASAAPPVPIASPALGLPSNIGPIGNNPAAALGPCGTPTGAESQGGTGGTTAQACMSAGLSYIGPAIGQISSVVGPTIITASFVGNIVNSAGNGIAGG